MYTPPIPKAHIPVKSGQAFLLLLVVATGLLLLAAPAKASYTELLAGSGPQQARTGQTGPARQTSPAQSHLVHLKGPKGTAPRLHSLGQDLPLAHALALLTPRGWLALGAHEAPMTRVSWLAKTPWLATLERIAQETNTLITLDWEEKTFTVQPYTDELLAKLTCRNSSPESAQGSPVSAKAAQNEAHASIPAGRPAAKPAPKPVPDQAASQASSQTTSQATSAATNPYDRPDLIVSHYAGPGRVYLARDMSVEEASRVLDTKLAKLMAWNNLQDRKATIRKGTLLWLDKPTASKPAPRAKAEPAAKAAASALAAPMADASVTRALAKAQAQAKPGADSPEASQKASRTTTSTTPTKPIAASMTATAPTAAASQTAGTSPNPTSTWAIAPGSLKRQMEGWAARAGFRVVWQADTDLHMAAGATFAGSFAKAVRDLFEGLHEAGAPYTAHIFHGNNVLHIGDR